MENATKPPPVDPTSTAGGAPAATAVAGSPSRVLKAVRVLEMGLEARAALSRLPASDLTWKESLSPHMLRLIHEARLAYYPAELLDRPPCVVDVGAYVGNWSYAMLRFTAPKQLIAVEPMPKSFAVLQRTTAGRPNVRLVPNAVGAERGKATLHLTTMANFDSLLPLDDEITHYYPDLRESAMIDVDVVPLDEILADVPEVSILKIDVQGMELPALDGARDVLRRTKAVQLEMQFVSHYKGDTLFDEMHARMNELGFRLYNIARPNYGADGRMVWTDAIYLQDR